MKAPKLPLLVFVCLLCAQGLFAQNANTFLVEAESFTSLGDWVVTSSWNGQKVIYSEFTPPRAAATRKIGAQEAGRYYVWANAFEFTESIEQFARKFKVSVNGEDLPVQGYASAHTGAWLWTCLGYVDLDAEAFDVSITALTSFCRVDALIFTKDQSFDPQTSASTSAQRLALTLSYQSFVTEVENFANKASWTKVSGYSGQGLLHAPTVYMGTPSTTVTAPKSGVYSVWASTYEFNLAREQAPRKFEVYIDSVKLALPAYRSYGCERFAWSYLGKAYLSASGSLVQIKAIANNARAEALLFTQDPDADPNVTNDRNTVQTFSDTFLLEAEDFHFYDGWTKISGFEQYLLNGTLSTGSPAAVAQFLRRGTYYVWASSADYPANAQGSRKYYVSAGGAQLPETGGDHGQDGVYWEPMGSANITSGEDLIRLIWISNLPKCDALIFTQDSTYDPNVAAAANSAYRTLITRAPAPISKGYQSSMAQAEETFDADLPESVLIQNDVMKVTFEKKQNANGESSYIRSAQILKDDVWTDLGAFEDECLFTLYASVSTRTETPYLSSWKETRAKYTLSASGQTYEFQGNVLDPYSAGDATRLSIISVTKTEDAAVSLIYSDGSTASFALPFAAEPIFKFSASKTVTQAGYYSYGFLAGNAAEFSKLKKAHLPPAFMSTRIMQEPAMVPLNLASQAMTILETESASGELESWALAADLDKVPFAWTTSKNSAYGFSMMAPDAARYQNAIFYPVLGTDASYKNSGDTLETSLYCYAGRAQWFEALACINENAYSSSKVREPFDVSLSDTLCNIAEYLKSSASGWNARNKGHWNIEISNTSTQASPLGEISLSILTDDEDSYVSRSLPTLEFTLSRSRTHFSYIAGTSDNWTSSMMVLSIPSAEWGGDYYASVNRLFDSQNSWLSEFYYAAGGGIKTYSSSGVPEWTALMGLYIAQPTSANLAAAKAAADIWLQNMDGTDFQTEIMYEYFSNYGTYPYWWYLTELYEATGDSTYLERARRYGFETLSALWAYPKQFEEDVSISPNNITRGIANTWWRGGERYRLGYDATRTALQSYLNLSDAQMASYTNYYYILSKTVPAKLVTRMGLGIEAPQTYTAGSAAPSLNIIMPAWAPALLRLYRYTHDDMLLKYSRHCLIGRYSNFPGYYVRDYIDLIHDEAYPYAGPDITSLYYHHAPVHFAHVMDYLMAEIEGRSNGLISFPYVRQQGYVWFTNRIFGPRGKVFGEENCRPLIHKTAVRVNSAKINVMLARSESALWAIFTNDAAAQTTAQITLDLTSKPLQNVAANGVYALYDSAGVKTAELAAGGAKTVTIPALGLAALRMPLASEEPYEVKTHAKTFHTSVASGSSSLGALHVFRIAGPFGKDSFYGVFAGQGGAQKITFFVKTPSLSKAVHVNSFPFEATVYGIDPDEDLEYALLIEEAGKTDIVINSLPTPAAWLKNNYENSEDYAGVFEDEDLDGLTGEEEYVVGTDPNDALSAHKISVSKSADGKNLISVNAIAGRTYEIFWSEDLLTWSAFSQNGKVAATADAQLVFTDDFSSSSSGVAQNKCARFYKISTSLTE